jgi:hypothetical protein
MSVGQRLYRCPTIRGNVGRKETRPTYRADALQATQGFSITNALALTVSNASTTGGVVVSDSGGISCGSACSAGFASGVIFKLTAIPVDGYQFTGWGGDCNVCLNANFCKLQMYTAKNCTANFEPFKIHRPLWKKALLSK